MQARKACFGGRGVWTGLNHDGITARRILLYGSPDKNAIRGYTFTSVPGSFFILKLVKRFYESFFQQHLH